MVHFRRQCKSFIPIITHSTFIRINFISSISRFSDIHLVHIYLYITSNETWRIFRSKKRVREYSFFDQTHYETLYYVLISILYLLIVRRKKIQKQSCLKRETKLTTGRRKIHSFEVEYDSK